jgi:hypothetical protein
MTDETIGLLILSFVAIAAFVVMAYAVWLSASDRNSGRKPTPAEVGGMPGVWQTSSGCNAVSCDAGGGGDC